MRKLRSVALMVAAMAIAVPLVAQKNAGYVKASVSPGRAGVFIDGKYVGPAANFRVARKYTVAPGEHEVRLAEPRYEERTVKIRVEPGKTTKIREQLKPVALAKPPFGTLRVIHPDKFAAVYLNGKYFGHVDEFSNFAQGMLLNPGNYQLRVEPTSGGQPISEKITITADKVTVVRRP